MANINITLDHPLKNGETITFKAPCDCTAVKGMIVSYPNDEGSATESKTFTFKDSHCNDLTELGNLFSENAVVAVVVNTETSAAHILNADTNAYLENKTTYTQKELKVLDTSYAESSSKFPAVYLKSIKTDAAVYIKGTLLMVTTMSLPSLEFVIPDIDGCKAEYCHSSWFTVVKNISTNEEFKVYIKPTGCLVNEKQSLLMSATRIDSGSFSVGNYQFMLCYMY